MYDILRSKHPGTTPWLVLQDQHEAIYGARGRKDCEDWVAVQLLSDEILNTIGDWDDTMQDLIETILINVYDLDIEHVDPVDPDGVWMKMESYVMAMVPAALHRTADRLVAEFNQKGLSLDPPDPRLHAV